MRYCVTVYNDNEHTFNYVIDVLSNELQVDPALAMIIAQHIDEFGSVSIEVVDLSAAESLQVRLRHHGPDGMLQHSTGPLKTSIEQGEELPALAWWNWQKAEFERARPRSPVPQMLPFDFTPFVVNAAGMFCAFITFVVLHFVGVDLQSDVVFRAVGKSASIVFILWSAVIYMRPIVETRRGHEPFPIPGLEFILIGTEIAAIVCFV